MEVLFVLFLWDKIDSNYRFEGFILEEENGLKFGKQEEWELKEIVNLNFFKELE